MAVSSRLISRLLIIAGLAAIGWYTFSTLNSTDEVWKKEIAESRTAKDLQFASASDSPIADSVRESFHGLSYFEPDPKYKVTATLERLPVPETYSMSLTGGKAEEYQKIGRLRFDLEGVSCGLSVFQRPESQKEDSWFIPFTDKSNGFESYGGGRYLDVPRSTSSELELDFNRAYNPYCAYQSSYFCPVPPRENHLNLKVLAGERTPEKK
jgi:uncharacterized protein (DUF1684 family)